jgi:hypothetical protein
MTVPPSGVFAGLRVECRVHRLDAEIALEPGPNTLNYQLGPVAEARIRHAKRYECLTAGQDYEITSDV